MLSGVNVNITTIYTWHLGEYVSHNRLHVPDKVTPYEGKFDVLILHRFNDPVSAICSVVKPVGGVVFIRQIVWFYVLLNVVVSDPIY